MVGNLGFEPRLREPQSLVLTITLITPCGNKKVVISCSKLCQTRGTYAWHRIFRLYTLWASEHTSMDLHLLAHPLAIGRYPTTFIYWQVAANKCICMSLALVRTNGGSGETRTRNRLLTYYQFSRLALHPARSLPCWLRVRDLNSFTHSQSVMPYRLG